MNIVDFHTHAFPDPVAEKAMPGLQKEGYIKAALDGKISSLLASMDTAGIHRSVVCSIATKPAQFDPILQWSKAIASDRLIPFPSVHPADRDAVTHVHRIHEQGFKGLKLHPYYQDFNLDDERAFPIYQAARDCGLIIACHTGFDLAFPRDRKADPRKILKVLAAFPTLRFVATHLFAWEDWDEVETHLLGKPFYTEISFTDGFLSDQRTCDLLRRHPSEFLLFGTDSPWRDQARTVRYVRRLRLGPEYERAIFSENALRLYGL